MNLSNPISSIIPSGHGAVLAVLARTDLPLSGRKVAELTGGQLSRSRANEVLAELTEAGILLCEERPPAKLYVLNRAHVAADAVVALTQLRGRLVERVRSRLETWSPAPMSAWLFGSFARGLGDARSDIDVLVVRPDHVLADDSAWTAQVDAFSSEVKLWSGNDCSIVEYSDSEFAKLDTDDERLVADIRRDGILLAGTEGADRARMGVR